MSKKGSQGWALVALLLSKKTLPIVSIIPFEPPTPEQDKQIKKSKTLSYKEEQKIFDDIGGFFV